MAGKAILLDVDGVLADFFGACCRLFGKDTEAEYAALTPANGWAFYRRWGLTDRDFWAAVDRAGEGFWAGLGQYFPARDLYEYCAAAAPTYFCTSAPLAPHAWAGKVKWLRAFTGGPQTNNIVMTAHKELLARPGTLLVDDSDGNCTKFRAAGGAAVLYPRHWNAREADAADAHARVLEEITAWAATPAT